MIGRVGLIAGLWAAPGAVWASPWSVDATFFDDMMQEPSAQVDAADLDGDGFIDVVFACGDGKISGTMADLRPQRYLHNVGGAGLTDGVIAGFTDQSLHGRAIKARDIDRDGDIDIVLGTTWQSQSQLYLNDGAGTFTLGTAGLPQVLASVDDFDIGDVDGDDDLDLVLTDWGADVFTGGRTMLWLQEGVATFVDATATQMPDELLPTADEVVLIDVDDDYDLDAVISCFGCAVNLDAGLRIFVNDGAGVFTQIVDFSAPTAVEPMHIDGDDALDLVMLSPTEVGNQVLINMLDGSFSYETDTYWPTGNDIGGEMVAFIDFNADAAADFVVVQRGGMADPVVVRQGGVFVSDSVVLDEPMPSTASSSFVFARLDGDDEPDIVMSQKEGALAKLVLLATGEFLTDTVPPRLSNVDAPPEGSFPGTAEFRVRCHDYKSPLMLHDFEEPTGYPYVETWTEDPGDPDTNPGEKSAPGRWYGEYLWRITVDVPDSDSIWYRVCAIDFAGNRGCTPLEPMGMAGTTGTGDDSSSGGEVSTGGGSSGSGGTDGAITTSGGVATTGVDPTGTDSAIASSGAETTGVTPTTAAPGGTSGGSEGDDGGALKFEPGNLCGCATSGTTLWALVLLGVRRQRRRPPPPMMGGAHANQTVRGDALGVASPLPNSSGSR